MLNMRIAKQCDRCDDATQCRPTSISLFLAAITKTQINPWTDYYKQTRRPNTGSSVKF